MNWSKGSDQLPVELIELLAGHSDASDFLEELAKISADHLSIRQDVLCGITQRREKKNVVVASSSEAARTMDEVQAGFDQGPCLEAQETGQTIRVSDVREETRWPDYMTSVQQAGLRSILSLPLTVEGSARAALNLYAEKPDAFNDDDEALATRYAALASRAMETALRIATYTELAGDQQAAMESRTAINVAVGIIMGQNRCSQDAAFSILTRASSHRNIKLRVLAQEMVASIGQDTPRTAFDP